MAINLFCSKCKSNSSLRSRICKNCGNEFSNGKKYRVVVKGQNGKRISKVLDNLFHTKLFAFFLGKVMRDYLDRVAKPCYPHRKDLARH